MSASENKIQQFHLDMLGELGNIGSGNAATALSQILNQTVYLEVPDVKLCNISDVSNNFGDPESEKTGVLFQTHETVNGYVLLIFEDADVKKIANIVACGMEIDAESVLAEIGNIVAGSYIGALASMLNSKIDLTPPQIAKDMLGSFIDGIVTLLSSTANEMVIIKTQLSVSEETIPTSFLLFLEDESLDMLLNYFNFEK